MTDPIQLKQKLCFNLSGQDAELHHTTVLYIVYRTIERNKKLTVNKLKALLSAEYLLSDALIEGALSGLVSRSMFACVKRWRNPQRPVGDMQIYVTEPPPDEFVEWLARTEAKHPELKVFDPPVYQHKHS